MAYIFPFLLLAIGGAFEHEQALHAKNFRGSSQAFRTALWGSVFASWGVRIAILLYVGFKLSWIAALVMFAGGMLVSGVVAGLLSATLARAAGPMGQVYISVAAFAIWPACFATAYLSLPNLT